MAANPVFVGTPKSWYASISAANTNRDGTGTTVAVVAGGSIGTRVDKVKIIAAGTVTNGVVRLFLTNGTTTILLKEILVTATVPSTTVAVFEAELTFADALLIQNGWTLKAAPHNAEAFNVIASGGDF